MGKFQRAIRDTKEVPHPTRRDLDMEAWAREYRARRSDEKDDKLFAAGTWLYPRLHAARRHVNDAVRHLKPGTPILRLAIAEINRRMRFITDKHNAQIKRLAEQGNSVNPGVVSRFKLSHTPTNEFSSDNLVALMGDVLQKLHRNYGATPTDIYFFYGQETVNIIHHLIDATLQEVQLENVWEGCVWLDYEVEESGDVTYIRCGRDNIYRSAASAEDRFNNNNLAVSAALEEGWKNGTVVPPPPIRWVRSANAGEDGVSCVLSDWRGEDIPPAPYRNRRSLLAGVPEKLLNASLPKFDEITPNMMFDAMEAIQSLGEIFFTRAAELSDELSASWMDSPIIPVGDCVGLVSEACRFDVEKAKQIVDILTLGKKNRDGAWEKPLIPAGDERLYISFPVLLTTNPIRLLDHWLIAGGVNTNDKGGALEQIARDELIAAFGKNKTVADGFVYESGLRLEGNNMPEIDALVRIGKRVLVCEIKSLIYPVTPRELHKHARTVFEVGVKQARAELDMAKRHRPKIAERTRYEGDPADLVFCNAVLVLGRIGSGLTVDDVPILDVELLAQYLSGGVLNFIYDSRNVFGDAADQITLYDDQHSAQENLLAYIKAPPTENLRHIHIKNDSVEAIDVYNGGKIISDNFVIEPFPSFEDMKSAVTATRAKWEIDSGFSPGRQPPAQGSPAPPKKTAPDSLGLVT